MKKLLLLASFSAAVAGLPACSGSGAASSSQSALPIPAANTVAAPAQSPANQVVGASATASKAAVPTPKAAPKKLPKPAAPTKETIHQTDRVISSDTIVS